MAKEVTFKVSRWMVKDLNLSGNYLLCYSFLYESSKKDGGDVLLISEVSNAINEDNNLCYCILLALQEKRLILFEKNDNSDVFTFKILPKDCMAQSVQKRNVTPKDDALFEECWKEYRRKGNKALAKPIWDKTPQDVRERIMPHIKAYVSVRERSYQEDFQRYLKNKTYDTVVYQRNNVIYDPEILIDRNEYRPITGDNIFWNSEKKIHVFFGNIETLCDGYTSENRPEGAELYQNAYTFVWDSKLKRWVNKQDYGRERSEKDA